MDQQREKVSKKTPKSFLLAHHPSCNHFSHHTISFRGRRLCMGCFVMYPTALVFLIILVALDSLFALDYLFLLTLSIILFGTNGARKLLLKDKISKTVHVLFRVLLGLSLALVMMSLLLATGIDQIMILALALGVAVVYNLYNGKHNLDVCKTCDQLSEFPHCDGFPDEE